MGIKVKSPGSCGELVQGTINGNPFLVTCPINLYSMVEIHLGRNGPLQAGEKVIDAIERTFAYLDTSIGNYGVNVCSALPVGKGMASSSADISAACQAAALSVGKSLTPDEIADIALAIEPTDGTFYPGVVAFDHVRGQIRQSIGMPPDMAIAVFDVGGEVDTVRFNQREDLAKLNAAKEPLVRKAFDLVSRGIAAGDCRLIGEGATLSARANQDILYKPCLETVIAKGVRYEAVGVAAAHSGTVLGVLFSQHQLEKIDSCIGEILQECPDIQFLKTVRLISGGLSVDKEGSCVAEFSE